MPSGYSKRSLVDKLGIKPGARVLILHPPKGYDELLGPMPVGVKRARRVEPGLDFIQCFTTSRKKLEDQWDNMAASLAAGGMLWISWPKKASGVTTDVTEDVLREVGLPRGLVDVKVCAVDDVWSGLKFLRRKGAPVPPPSVRRSPTRSSPRS